MSQPPPPPPPGLPPYQPPPYQPPPPYAYRPMSPPRRTNGLAIASLVCGVLWGFGVLAVVALILGLIAKSHIKQKGEGGSGFATAGIVLGIVGIVGGILSAVAVVLIWNEAEKFSNEPAVVVVETDSEICYTITLVTGTINLSETEERACGDAFFELGTGLSRHAEITRTSGVGPIVATLVIDDEIVEERTTRGRTLVIPEIQED